MHSETSSSARMLACGWPGQSDAVMGLSQYIAQYDKFDRKEKRKRTALRDGKIHSHTISRDIHSIGLVEHIAQVWQIKEVFSFIQMCT